MLASQGSATILDNSDSSDIPTRRQSRPTDEFEAFYRKHGRIAGELPYIVEVYEECDRVTSKAAPPAFEEAFNHVFGAAPAAYGCERCYPAFFRKKQIVGALSVR